MISDPGLVNLRKAGRAAIVAPLLFAFAVGVLDNDDLALFAAFGSFAALVFGDFGGALRGRARAYLAVLVVGSGLVAGGTALSNTTVAAVIVTVAVGFVVVFLGSLGGYFAASGVTVVLSYVLAVMVPAPDGAIPERIAGWALGVGTALVAALLLWPLEERRAVRLACADLADAIAHTLLARTDDALDAARRAAGELARRTGTVFRPAGNASRDRASVALVHELRFALRFLEELPSDETVTARAVRTEIAATLQRAAACVRVPQATVDVGGLVRARAAHTEELETWAHSTGPRSRPDAALVVEQFDHVFPLRGLSLRAIAVAAEAAASTGAELVGVDAAHDHAPADLRFLSPATSVASWRTVLRDHLDPRSVRLQAAVRAAVGLAAAVAIAKAFDLDHAFWVVLGTLSVLRTNALGTGVTALQAVLGTALGFVIATVVIVLVGGDTAWLWTLLPVTAFVAAYAPGALHFALGQAFFTVFIVVLFNLIEPEGWRTGLVRVEDIALGVAISLLVGIVLWPRGARRAAVNTFSAMLRDGAAFVRAALGAVVADADAPASPPDDPRREAVASRTRAISALEDLTVERGGGHVDRESWIALLALDDSLRLAGDGLDRIARDGPRPGCADARHALGRNGDQLVAAVERVMARLSDPTLPSPDPLDAPATDALCACVVARGDGDEDTPTDLLWTRELLALVDARVLSISTGDPDRSLG